MGLILVCFLSSIQTPPFPSLSISFPLSLLQAPLGRGFGSSLQQTPTISRYRTSGAVAAAISLLIGVAPVSAATGRPSKIRLHHIGGSRGRWFSWSEG